MTTIKFREWNCILNFKRYSNGRIAIELRDNLDYSPVAVATINLPEVILEDPTTDVIIKDYSENTGMFDTLLNAGIIDKPYKYVSSGHIVAPVCKLLVKPE